MNLLNGYPGDIHERALTGFRPMPARLRGKAPLCTGAKTKGDPRLDDDPPGESIPLHIKNLIAFGFAYQLSPGNAEKKTGRIHRLIEKVKDEINEFREDSAFTLLLLLKPFEFLVREGFGIFPGFPCRDTG